MMIKKTLVMGAVALGLAYNPAVCPRLYHHRRLIDFVPISGRDPGSPVRGLVIVT